MFNSLVSELLCGGNFGTLVILSVVLFPSKSPADSSVFFESLFFEEVLSAFVGDCLA